MPEAIAFQFRQAITARTRLSKVFRKVSKGSGELASYTQLEDAEYRLTSSGSIRSSADLLESYIKLRDSFDLATSPDASCLRSEAAENGISAHAFKTPLPPEVRLRQGPDTSASDAQFRSILFHNVAQCTRGSYLQNSFIRLGSPYVAEVDSFMSREQTPRDCLHCASGLSLLMSSYKAYAFALPAGQCAVAQIGAVLDDPTMPCRCNGTLAFHLERLKRDLEDYLRTKMFDLFFQSPWVCGGQILEMMHALRYYGLRLAAYKSYMGSVMHMYNVLRKIHKFTPVPVLETICEHLGDLFFPGGLPDNKTFKSCYVRYLGGRLRFHSRARHQTGCHELAIPVHTAKATAGFVSEGGAPLDPRFDCGRLSLIYRFKERNYRFDDATLDAVNSRAHFDDVYREDVGAFAASGTRSRKTIGTVGHVANSCKHEGILDDPASDSDPGILGVSRALQPALDTELASDFPVASLNFFPLYLDCVRVVDSISNAYHGADSKPRQFCLCYAEILVAAADGCREGKGWRVRKEIRDLVALCGQALTDGFGGKELKQYYHPQF
ncbi:MAG: hypothetical protein Q9169_003047 [Polycauliona sp. 2 TL-2023]